MDQPLPESHIYTIISNALNIDPIIRKESETQITSYITSSFPSFLTTLSSFLSNTAFPKDIRQLSATLIKNIITNINLLHFKVLSFLNSKIILIIN